MDNPLRPFPMVLVTGGCRSGKSAYAERLARRFSASRLYIATAEVLDEEMRERVRLHREARGEGWRLHEVSRKEAPGLWKELPGLIRPGEAVLLDCLTLWTSACMEGSRPVDTFPGLCQKLLAAFWELDCPVVLVNNEVGMGVVPSSQAGRTFRDMAGFAAQTAASLATNVVLMVSGIPVAVKGELPLA